jgi:hypothetical protein
MGLSSFKDIPLAEAREEARKMGRIARCEKRDPIEMRKAERSEAAADQARSITFRQCATEFIEDFRKRWTNETHAGQWEKSDEIARADDRYQEIIACPTRAKRPTAPLLFHFGFGYMYLCAQGVRDRL